ncbi:glycosyltransferase family 39 protein [Limibacter armeniacum]|uniref:glycosyltransferase family 39 protein n=1 Tax=Limibacter armeniacum TaxID=466084 RepID=UPI002FE63CB8
MNKRTIILLGIILLKFLLQFMLISPEFDLHRDEYLHLDQANHLAWGFLSVPPLTSWISYIIQLLGNSVFWVKFFPALFGALTILTVWETIRELKGNLFACMLGATGLVFSSLLRLNTLYQPNSLDVLCWTAFYLMLIKYINSQHIKWLFAGALVFATGFLNKYNIAFLLIGLLPALLLSPHRKVLTQSSFYLALLAGSTLILPNLVWQYQNEFPVFKHLQELSATQLVNVNRMDFISSQFWFFFGSLPVIVAGLYALFFYKPFRPYRLFGWSLCFTLAVFIYLKAKDYYAIGLYPIYIAFGATYLSNVLAEGWKKFLMPVLYLLPVLFFIPAYQIGFPNKSPEFMYQNKEQYSEMGLLRWEDGKEHDLPQDYADMLGWKELAHKVDSLYAIMPHPDQTLILCDNYGQAGAINFYSKRGIHAVSFNADYINWFDLSKQYINLIRVKENKEVEMELKETSPYFELSAISGTVTNPYAREYGTTIFSFVGAKVDVRQRISDEIVEVRGY